MIKVLLAIIMVSGTSGMLVANFVHNFRKKTEKAREKEREKEREKAKEAKVQNLLQELLEKSKPKKRHFFLEKALQNSNGDKKNWGKDVPILNKAEGEEKLLLSLRSPKSIEVLKSEPLTWQEKIEFDWKKKIAELSKVLELRKKPFFTRKFFNRYIPLYMEHDWEKKNWSERRPLLKEFLQVLGFESWLKAFENSINYEDSETIYTDWKEEFRNCESAMNENWIDLLGDRLIEGHAARAAFKKILKKATERKAKEPISQEKGKSFFGRDRVKIQDTGELPKPSSSQS